MDLHPTKAWEPFSFRIYSPVVISEDEQKLLREIAGHLDLTLPSDFFELGDLERNELSPAILGASGVQGSLEAKKKYKAIRGILDTLDEMVKASPFLDGIGKVRCLAFALENRGTSFDEDIRVRITLPKESAFTFEDILKLDRGALEYMAYDCDFDAVFGIKRGADFLAYESSCRRNRPMTMPPLRFPGYPGSEDVDFGDVIPSLFDFDMVERGSDWQIEVEFDEIMQHTAVAFPELILLKGDLSEIEYTIRSKHIADAISGAILVEGEL